MLRVVLLSAVVTAAILILAASIPWSADWLGVQALHLRSQDSVVRIEVNWSLIEKNAMGADKRPIRQLPIFGTAFVIREDGYALTAAHVLYGWDAIRGRPYTSDEVKHESIRVYRDARYTADQPREVRVVGRGAADSVAFERDVKLIKIEGGGPWLPFCFGTELTAHRDIDLVALGYPARRTSMSVAYGKVKNENSDDGNVEAEIGIESGFSGGPIVTLEGAVVGISRAGMGGTSTKTIIPYERFAVITDGHTSGLCRLPSGIRNLPISRVLEASFIRVGLAPSRTLYLSSAVVFAVLVWCLTALALLPFSPSARRGGRAAYQTPLSLQSEIVTVPPDREIVGRSDALASVVARFSLSNIVAIIGPRGVGKTTVAFKSAHVLRKRESDRGPGAYLLFSCRGGPYTVSEVCDALALQLDLPAVTAASGPAKRALFQALVARAGFPIFIVFDNFESLSQLQADVYRFLSELPSRVRILLTSSERPSWIPAEKVVEVRGMDEAESVEFLQSRLTGIGLLPAVGGVDGAALRRVHVSTGGNPLAMDWLVGQLKQGFAISSIVSQLETGVHQTVTSILFDGTWTQLRDSARALLGFAAAFPDHAPLVLLRRALGWGESEFHGTLNEVALFNLIEIIRGTQELGDALKLHPLVQSYVNAIYVNNPIAERLGTVTNVYSSFLGENLEISAGSRALVDIEAELVNVLPLVDRTKVQCGAAVSTTLIEGVEDYLNLFGLYDARGRLSRQAAEYFISVGAFPEASQMLTIAAGSLVSQGNLLEAVKTAREALAHANAVGSPSLEAHALRILGISQYKLGEDSAAQDCLLRGWELGKAADDKEILVELCFLAANLCVVQRDWRGVRSWIGKAVNVAEEMRWERPRGYAAGMFARVFLEESRLAEARDEINIGLAVARRFVDRRLYVRIGLLRRSLVAREGRANEFKAQGEELESLITRLGLRLEAQELRAQDEYWTAGRRWWYKLFGRLNRTSPPVRYSSVRLDGV